MTHTHYIHNLKDSTIPPTLGSKAEQLRYLFEKRFHVPETYVCNWDAYTRYIENDRQIREIVREELSGKIDEHRTYAVRSSASLEDGHHHSFAGQFKSILNVQGVDNIMRAIEVVWSSVGSYAVRSYLERRGIDPRHLKMSVIIQEMVPPLYSGVSFSKNPITGMDETIVEAVSGSGETLMQNGVTPKRWTNKWGKWIGRIDSGDIDLDVIQEVVTETKEISRLYGGDVDLEWVYDGSTINWVQLRKITTLHKTDLYSNTFAREVFPGMIKPLIWSTNTPIVCEAWVKIFTELIGKNDIDPHSLAKPFYYRAYFNMATIGKILKALGLPSNTIELLMEVDREGAERPSFRPAKKTIVLLPRMLSFAIDKVRFSKKIKAFLPAAKSRYHSFSTGHIGHLDEKVIIKEIKRLYALNEDTAYHTIITYLSMGLYNGILKHQLNRLGVDIENVDLTEGMEELTQFDPTIHLRNLSRQFNELDEEVKDTIRKSSFAEFSTLKNIDAFQSGVIRFINRFGHLSDSGNDFSSVPWREAPDTVLKMITTYTHPGDTRVAKLRFADVPIPALRRLLLNPIYKRARTFRFYREELGSLYTFGYGLFRTYFLSLADHFVRRGIIADREDIFYLYYDEIKSLIDQDPVECTYKETILQRKREMNDYQDIILPNTIYGDRPPPVKPQKGARLKGVPTSKGYFKGPVRIVKGIQDLHKLREGDVLVIPHSDVGWTPLFAKAKAIIAESGGFLSHSSIIAREYGIPAIVSVAGACHLRDGVTVTVDGYQGEIIVHDPSET